jgi:hypothetical protein
MAYYNVIVGEDELKGDFKIDSGSIVEAAREGRNAWRDRNRAKDSKEMFRIPEPKNVVVVLIGTGIPGE